MDNIFCKLYSYYPYSVFFSVVTESVEELGSR